MDDEKEEPRDLDALLQRIPPFIPPFSFTLHLRYILYIHVHGVLCFLDCFLTRNRIALC